MCHHITHFREYIKQLLQDIFVIVSNPACVTAPTQWAPKHARIVGSQMCNIVGLVSHTEAALSSQVDVDECSCRQFVVCRPHVLQSRVSSVYLTSIPVARMWPQPVIRRRQRPANSAVSSDNISVIRSPLRQCHFQRCLSQCQIRSSSSRRVLEIAQEGATWAIWARRITCPARGRRRCLTLVDIRDRSPYSFHSVIWSHNDICQLVAYFCLVIARLA